MTTMCDKQQPPIKVDCFGRRGNSIRRPHVPWRCVSRGPLLSQRQRDAAAVPARYTPPPLLPPPQADFCHSCRRSSDHEQGSEVTSRYSPDHHVFTVL